MRVDSFLARDPAGLIGDLAAADARRFRRNEPQQIRAWEISLACLRSALQGWEAADQWELVLEFELLRLGRRIDAVLVTPRGILVLEFKAGASIATTAAREQVEDYALDLRYFHACSGAHPIVPLLIATEAKPAAVPIPLLLSGHVAPTLTCDGAGLGLLLQELWVAMPEPAHPLDVAGWARAPYRPIPGIIEAACTLYERHGVEEIASARADIRNLTATTQAIMSAMDEARREQRHIVVFVTGIPGAGKTLCGLNTVFGAGRSTGAVFLTGNPSLVHVLREALARDAARGERGRLRAARLKTRAEIQALPAFRDENIPLTAPPHERVIVIDEGQRVWNAAHAIRKSRDRPVKLTTSEPGHLLDIMARHPDWAVVVCLVGGGQEIHDGEGGLAEWGTALAARPNWQVLASPGTLSGSDPRQMLPPLPGMRFNGDLHLDIPVRNLRSEASGPWVDAVLSGDAATARNIAAHSGHLPFRLTREADAMRARLRHAGLEGRRAGLVASSGAKRLRAEGIGPELPHMDAAAVAHWFLDRWPGDIRASDALEVIASEFSCQGLELDVVGLCWGNDLLRQRDAWRVRDFVGTDWQFPRGAESIANRLNTYRVLLTRARYETVIWVPHGDIADRTRDPREFDAIADFLEACGARPLESETAPGLPDAAPQATLF